MRVLLALLGSLALAACTATPASPGPSASPGSPAPAASPTAPAPLAGDLPLCDDVPPLEAPADWYRDARILFGDQSPEWNAITSWARRQPGFEELWIDRALHEGWLTLAFSNGAEDRQRDLMEGFPDVAVVALPVDWSMADLMVLQQRVSAVLRPELKSFATGIYPQFGVVRAEIYFLRPEWIALLNQEFAGERVCIEGVDPALAPSEGPQQPAGEGWRLVADQDETGNAYWTAIAYDDESYARMWEAANLTGRPPEVDFESEVAIWFGAVHGSSCPRQRLDDVRVDEESPLVHAVITNLDAGACTADAIPHAYVVAFERSRLPRGPFAIQLGAEDPPPGAMGERTVVHVDLSEPGSAAGAGDITRGGAIP